MKKSITTIFFIILVDSIGIGLIIPILPSLLHILNATNVAKAYGFLIALYSLFQIICAPILGTLSDRFGRRPILIISLIGMATNYLMIAFSHKLWILYFGRIIAGITASNMTVANAYIADVTPNDKRAKQYGMLNAAFGVGFIIGPVLGGTLGDIISIHAPFILAALCSAINLILTILFLPESHKKKNQSFRLIQLIPLRSLLWVSKLKQLIPCVIVYFLLMLAVQSPQSLWVLYTQDRFHWTMQIVGISVACFGLGIAIFQAFITGNAVKKIGEYKTFVLGVVLQFIFFILLTFAVRGWILFSIIPIGALASICTPALQSIMSKQVSENSQGELQGTLTSISSLTTIISPILATFLYSITKSFFPGLTWLLISFLFPVALVIFIAQNNQKNI